ncbi:S2-RNase [Pyrus ussuriensis x Pyrus communis]|uniref:S2-RNase n=1 Tax=Pyrus ussuriensis x Pyrus communis TaxID=2448454 RepID=A0A5N5FAI9_9ROSA|nr:S2-RNase [Pyrus ussuriensis x Pyrus communis]
MNDETWSQWVEELESIWKQKWMMNGIYELIMMLKIIVPVKHEFLSTTLLFWNNETNTFDFIMGFMTPTWGASVLRRYPWFSDQHFQDLFGEDASSSYKENDRVGYKCGLKAYHPNFCGRQLEFRTSYNFRSPSKVTFRASWRSLEMMSRITRKHVALNFEWSKKYDGDIREAHDRLFGIPKQRELHSPSLILFQPDRCIFLILGTSTPQVGQAPALHSSILPSVMVVTPTSQFNPTTREMLYFVEDDSASSSLMLETITQSPPTFGKLIVPEIPVVSEVTSSKVLQAPSQPAVSKVAFPWPPKASGITRIPIPWPRKAAATKAPLTINSEAITIVISISRHSKRLRMLSLSYTRLNICQMALRDQHLRAERQVNRVKCYKEKHSRTSTSLQQLVENGLTMEDKIKVVAFEIQTLEEQLFPFKIEEVKRVNQEVEDSKAQLDNNNIALEEPGKIFTIMQTYHSRMAALARDLKLLG